MDPTRLRTVTRAHLSWLQWEALIRSRGITIDRPKHRPHPRYPDIIYPLSYGYINETISSDGEPVDVFVGTAPTGLVGLLHTTDYREADYESKLLYNCTPTEIYTVHGFINYDRTLLEGVLVLRHPMHTLWAALQESAS